MCNGVDMNSRAGVQTDEKLGLIFLTRLLRVCKSQKTSFKIKLSIGDMNTECVIVKSYGLSL